MLWHNLEKCGRKLKLALNNLPSIQFASLNTKSKILKGLLIVFHRAVFLVHLEIKAKSYIVNKTLQLTQL